MRIVGKFGVAFVILQFSGCTAEQLYDFGADVGRNQADCASLISYDERLRCEEAFSKEYEEYQADREVLEAKSRSE